MDEKLTKTVKITMPHTFANQFIEESRLNFNDSRWLNVAFKDKMYFALLNIQSTSVKERVEQVRDELIQLIKEMYGGLK
jgi:hypothetical protein